MQVLPAFDDFARGYGARQPVLIWTSLVADLETPVSVMLKLADGRPMSFLLESVEGGSVRGRYSIIGLKPDLIWRCRGDVAELNRRARSDADAFEREAKPALASLKDLIAECRVETPAPLPPMASGLFGYMGYNMVGLMERLDPKINLEFNAYFLDTALKAGLQILECPISFHPRVGTSKGGNVNNRIATRLGMRMLFGIFVDWRGFTDER